MKAKQKNVAVAVAKAIMPSDANVRVREAAQEFAASELHGMRACTALVPIFEAATTYALWEGMREDWQNFYAVAKMELAKSRGIQQIALTDHALTVAWSRMVARVNEMRAEQKLPTFVKPAQVGDAARKKAKRAQAATAPAPDYNALAAERKGLAKAKDAKSIRRVAEIAAIFERKEKAEQKAREGAKKAAAAVAKAIGAKEVPTAAIEAVRVIQTANDAALIQWVLHPANRPLVVDLMNRTTAERLEADAARKAELAKTE